MNILQVSTYDRAGGAERVVWNLMHAYRSSGHGSWLAVGFRRTNEACVLEIPRYVEEQDYGFRWRKIHRRLDRLGKRFSLARRLRYVLCDLTGGCPDIDRERGRENYHFSGSRRLLEIPPEKPDIVHLHNLHGDYFDLRFLPELSRKVPTVLTLHDAWLLGGHCAHSFDCGKWESGCFDCPRLSLYVPIRKDSSRFNWERKKRILDSCSLYVSTPCEWLMDKIRRSPIMGKAIRESRVIPNGVDLGVYKPEDQLAVRREMDVGPQSKVILFSAAGTVDNPWKDYTTMRDAVLAVGGKVKGDVVFLVLGQGFENVEEGRIRIIHLPFEDDERKVAAYYQAADVYLHAAKADTFPNSVLEAMACGTPVVATAVGGIPEQVDDGVTGFLVPEMNPSVMAERLVKIIENRDLQLRLSCAARARAEQAYSLDKQVSAYLDWFCQILTLQWH